MRATPQRSGLHSLEPGDTTSGLHRPHHATSLGPRRGSSRSRSEARRARQGIYTPLPLLSLLAFFPVHQGRQSQGIRYQDVQSPHQTTTEHPIKLRRNGRLRPVLQLQLQLRKGQLHLRASLSFPRSRLLIPPRQLSTIKVSPTNSIRHTEVIHSACRAKGENKGRWGDDKEGISDFSLGSNV